MKLILQRTKLAGDKTFGELKTEDGDHICYTLEDQVREVEGKPVADWKVHGQTAIPTSAYNGSDYPLFLATSGRFGPNTLTIEPVKGFAGVRMHAGNTVADTEGCPLLGVNQTPTGVSNCAPAVNKVKQIVNAAIINGDKVFLEIINP